MLSKKSVELLRREPSSESFQEFCRPRLKAHKHLERAPPDKPRLEILVEAASEVGPALFFSLLIITVSFLPIFTLEAQEGRLFGPLAYTKTFAMAAAAVLSITLVPALMVLFVRGRIIPEHENPLNRFLIAIYRPVIRLVLQAKTLTILIALGVLAVAIWPVTRLGTEFMPNLNEGTLLYMPTTLPGLSVTKSAELLQMQDRIIKSFPEVESVYGKAGRAQTATDPAPIEMFETVINLKPKEQWRPGLTIDGLIQEMDRSLQFPGVSNAWTMPIKARIDMLSTGIRTPVGVKVIGRDLTEMEKVAREVERALKTVDGTASAYAERVVGGYYLEIIPDRDKLARYGLMVSDVQDVVGTALGAEPITTTVEGRERYTVAIRYPRDLRSDPQSIAKDVLVALPGSAGTVPLGEVADIRRYSRPRPRRLRRRRPEGSGRTGKASCRHLPGVEWPVRIPRTRRGPPAGGGAGDVDDHLPAALPQLPQAHRNPHRHAVVAVRAGRRDVALVVPRVQHVGGGGGWVHRLGRCRRRNRRCHAHLPRPCSRGNSRPMCCRRTTIYAQRSLPGNHGRGRRTCPPQDDDRRCHHGRVAAHHVEHGHRV
jgi:Cu(I)/Ag(I) efflux system membrane protein CusA/SilA